MLAVSAPLARLLFAGLALIPAAVSAQAIQRCESKDGRVTYSNTTCPAGTAPVRKVNTEPPISVDDRKAAQERARTEGAAAQQAEKERTQREARERKQADERAKAEAKARERCENARRSLERSAAARAELNTRPSTAEKIDKAEAEVKRRESEVAQECGR
jgi:predicted ribosome quality control (RQC) complex YloA/Tae2 family protein